MFLVCVRPLFVHLPHTSASQADEWQVVANMFPATSNLHLLGCVHQSVPTLINYCINGITNVI